jgi:hypothetical protein
MFDMHPSLFGFWECPLKSGFSGILFAGNKYFLQVTLGGILGNKIFEAPPQ